MSMTENGLKFHPLPTRRTAFKSADSGRQHRAQIKADKRRLAFLRGLSTSAPELTENEAWFVEDLLRRANECAYHYEFKFGERTITDSIKSKVGKP
jgi:hypothetical protein